MSGNNDAYAAMLKYIELRKAQRLADETNRRKISIGETQKAMDKILTFESTNGLRRGRWYWVRYIDDPDWFPALWEEYGWTNEDCWNELFDDITNIGEWKLIPLPEEIR